MGLRRVSTKRLNIRLRPYLRERRKFAWIAFRSLEMLPVLALIALIQFISAIGLSAADKRDIETSFGSDLLERLLAVETLCNVPCPPADTADSLRSQMDDLARQ